MRLCIAITESQTKRYVSALRYFLIGLHLCLGLVCSIPSEDWIRRPETVYVCEGNTAHFIWDYREEMGTFEACYINKIRPDHQELLVRNGYSRVLMDRAEFVEDQNSGFNLRNVTLSDNGTFEIEVYLDKPPKRISDKADLHVIKAEACPNREVFEHPDTFVKHRLTNSPVHKNPNGSLVMKESGNLTLVVRVPASDPPVKCLISAGLQRQSCEGLRTGSGDCEIELCPDKLEDNSVEVNLSFVAYQTSSTRIKVFAEDTTEVDNNTPPPFILTVEPGTSREVCTTTAVLSAVLSGVACAIVCFTIGYLAGTKRVLENLRGIKQTRGNEEARQITTENKGSENESMLNAQNRLSCPAQMSCPAV